ncbi:MAG TPA: sugar phosphate isomerase/epimerase family protein [Gemmataceae bacterium]|nr:sugar phosphate isomerase/epimerase family protein [Gemmataceae bacterium]
MFTLSAFADEISPDPQEQIDVLLRCGVRCIELRSIHKTNVLDLTDLQVKEFKSLLDKHGFRLSAIGSPIGKVKIDSPWEPHLARFERALELCKVFGTSNIRVFSYYPPRDAETWDSVSESWEHELFRRMDEKVGLASRADVRLVHENEHRIFGDSPDRVRRLFEMVQADAFRAVYDAANYVFCGYDPWDGWEKTREFTAHFHIKDWIAGEKHGCLAGEGQGQWPDVIPDANARGYDGFATLEPHLLGGGPTGGVTGPELFPKAVAAFRAILDKAGIKYE